MPEQYSDFSDQLLMEKFQQTGNTQLLGELYKRYAMLVYGLCYKYLKNEQDAKDSVNDIFELVLENASKQPIAYFRAWIYSVSKNHLYKKTKKNNPLEITELEKFSEKFMENEMDLTLYEKEEQRELLTKAISNLSEEQRTCIELFYYQQKSYQEVASISGYDLNKVKSAIQNGKRNLKLFMEENSTQHEG